MTHVSSLFWTRHEYRVEEGALPWPAWHMCSELAVCGALQVLQVATCWGAVLRLIGRQMNVVVFEVSLDPTSFHPPTSTSECCQTNLAIDPLSRTGCEVIQMSIMTQMDMKPTCSPIHKGGSGCHRRFGILTNFRFFEGFTLGSSPVPVIVTTTIITTTTSFVVDTSYFQLRTIIGKGDNRDNRDNY